MLATQFLHSSFIMQQMFNAVGAEKWEMMFYYRQPFFEVYECDSLCVVFVGLE